MNFKVHIAAITLVALVCGLSQTAFARPLVLIISIDGLGAELLKSVPPEDVPYLTRLAQEGVAAPTAKTIDLAKTIPAHASMLSGVTVEKHRRTHNDLDPDLKKLEVPTIFDLAKLRRLRTSAIFGKDKLSFLFDTGGLDKNMIPRAWPIGDWWGRIPSVVDEAAIEVIKTDKPDLLFIHYAAVDSMGHIFDWGSTPQRWALRQVDASLGRLFSFLNRTETTGADGVHDGYAVIVTADHGGHGPSHGQGTPAGTLESPQTDLYIPWIAYRSARNGIDNSQRAELVDSKATVIVYDTAATAAALLELEMPPTWSWDGVNRLRTKNINARSHDGVR